MESLCSNLKSRTAFHIDSRWEQNSGRPWCVGDGGRWGDSIWALLFCYSILQLPRSVIGEMGERELGGFWCFSLGSGHA